MVLRARLEVFGWVYAWLVVGSCININRTRAAAAREGCREMDAARKNRRPGVWTRAGVLEGRGGTCGGVVLALAVRWCYEVVCESFGCRFEQRAWRERESRLTSRPRPGVHCLETV